MKIVYKDKKVEDLCTNFKTAKKRLSEFAKDLMAKINYIENAASFEDIRSYIPFHCHPLSHDKKDYWSLDVKGRKCSWRIIAAPLDENNEIIKSKDDPYFVQKCSQIKIILVEEISNHYE